MSEAERRDSMERACNYKIVSKSALEEILLELRNNNIPYVCSTYGVLIYIVEHTEYVVMIK